MTEKTNNIPLVESQNDLKANDLLLVTTKIDDADTCEIGFNEATAAVPFGQDSCFGWVVVAASFGSCWLIGIAFIAFSILYMDFSAHFESPSGVTGWIGSLYLATGNILGIVISVFVKQYGCRLICIVGGFIWSVGFGLSSVATSITFLYFSYGLLAGIGFNMVTLSSFVIVQQHFTKHRGMAAGIAAAGISFGTLTSGPIIAVLTQWFGWRGALLILSGLTLQSCVFGCFYRPQCQYSIAKAASAESGSTGKNGGVQAKGNLGDLFIALFKGTFNVSIFYHVSFTLVCIGTFFMNAGSTIFYQHTPSRAKFVGIIRNEVVLIPTVVGLATAISRIAGAAIGNLRCTNRTLQYGVSMLIAGFLLILSAHMYTFISIAIVGAAIGSLVGFSLTVQTTMLTDLVGVDNIARAQAFILIFTGIGALIAVPLAGFIFDKTQDYHIPFYTGGCFHIFGSLMVVSSVIIKKLHKNS